jgi:hypothetical protein
MNLLDFRAAYRQARRMLSAQCIARLQQAPSARRAVDSVPSHAAKRIRYKDIEWSAPQNWQELAEFDGK